MAALIAAQELRCLFGIKDEDLQGLVATRSELHRLLSPLVTDSVQALLCSESRLDLAPRWSIWKRRKSDWHECFFPEDLTWSGLVDDGRAKGSGMVIPLLQHAAYQSDHMIMA
jgi:hypothetical protein